MSTDEKITAEQLESGSIQPTEKKKKGVCGFCRWYYWVAGVCLFVLVFMLIVAFAIIPAVAQKKVDKSYLVINSLDIMKPRPEGFSLGINSTLEGAHSTKATIDAFTADFYLDGGDPFIQVDLPKVKVGHGDTYIVVNDRKTDVINDAGFSKFAKTLFESEEFSVKVKGDTKIHVAAFKANIDYRETVTTKGVNGLKGMKITHYDLKIDGSGPNGSNIIGKVEIPNPSHVTIETGTVEFSMGNSGKELGIGFLPDLTLIPGTHEYDFHAKANITSLLNAISAHKKSDGPLYLQIVGRKVTYGDVEIPWLTTILASKAIDCELA